MQGDTWIPTVLFPDFNDIEPKWIQAKAIRRKEDCSVEQLFATYAFWINLYDMAYN